MNKKSSSVAVIALLFMACASSSFASGGSGGGGTSGGGGGGTVVLPQVAGAWYGTEQYQDNLGNSFGNPFNVGYQIAEDIAGNITGRDLVMGVLITGRAQSNGTVDVLDGAYYGQKFTVSETGPMQCSDGSVGRVLTGKFKRREGQGAISIGSCK